MFTIIGALLIGLTLGLLGSGGSAITVPVLIYLVGHDTKQSIAESMAIVGLISLAAVIPYARARQIDWHSVWSFGLPGMLGTFVGAWLGGVATEAIQLVVFGGVLVLAAYIMLRKGAPEQDAEEPLSRSPLWKIATEGAVVGVITGFVGVGGGFLIVPALVVLGGLPMRLAIGTSLVIISIKAAVGFAKYEQYLLAHDMTVDLGTVVLFVLLGIFGSFAGKSLNSKLSPQALRKAFALFLVVLGSFVIVNEGRKLIARNAPTAGHSVEHVARGVEITPER